MCNESKKKYFEILELNPDASFSEVKSAYLHLKNLYSSKSLAISPIMDDISEERRIEILDQLEEAYEILKECLFVEEKQKQQIKKERVERRNIPEFEVYSGDALRLIREVLGVELEEISLYSGIPIKHLKCIEKEDFSHLPPSGYFKIYVKKYAEYLSLNAEKVVDDYMNNYEKKMEKLR
jgi:curved DNA-binding protein CbpA